MPNSSQLRSSVSTCTRESSSRICAATGVPSVGTLWSAVASVRSGRRTVPAGEPQPLERLRRGDLVDEVQVDVEQAVGDLVRLPDLVEQRLGVIERQLLLRPAATTAQKRASLLAVVLEVVRQVGVEGHAVARRRARGARRRRRSVSAPALDDRGLAAAGLVHRRVAGPAGRGAGRERVQRDLGALAGQRRREHLVAVAAGAAAAALAGADDATRRRPRRGAAAGRALSSSPAAIRSATASVGLVSPRSTCESIGARDAASARRGRAARGPSPRAGPDPRTERE